MTNREWEAQQMAGRPAKTYVALAENTKPMEDINKGKKFSFEGKKAKLFQHLNFFWVQFFLHDILTDGDIASTDGWIRKFEAFVLCSCNKSKPETCKRKGVYKYKCPCDENAVYLGQTIRSYEQRRQEHGKAVEKKQWQHSGISQHFEKMW